MYTATNTPIGALTTFMLFIQHHLLAKKFCILFYSDRLKMSSSLTAWVCSRPWNEEIKEVKALKRCQIESCALFLKTWKNIVSIFFPSLCYSSTSPLFPLCSPTLKPHSVPDLHLKHTPAVFVSRSLSRCHRFGRPLPPAFYFLNYIFLCIIQRKKQPVA